MLKGKSHPRLVRGFLLFSRLRQVSGLKRHSKGPLTWDRTRTGMWCWTRKLCLALLLASWALAVGLHDFVLDDHDHDANGPETVITQVWHSELTPAVPLVPNFVALVLLVILAQLIPLALDQQGVPKAPESRHSPPRPPTLRNLLFRGPPAQALPFAKSRKQENPCAQILYRAILAGYWPAAARPTA